MATNQEQANGDQMFLKACNLAGCKPTKRQYSKYRNGRRGLAIQAYNEHLKEFKHKNLGKPGEQKPVPVQCAQCGRFVGKNDPGRDQNLCKRCYKLFQR